MIIFKTKERKIKSESRLNLSIQSNLLNVHDNNNKNNSGNNDKITIYIFNTF